MKIPTRVPTSPGLVALALLALSSAPAQAAGCIGAACILPLDLTGETLRLKETGLTIFFEDVSSGGAPSNDWRIQANDSSANFFAIQDAETLSTPLRIEAGAPSNAIFVGANGNLGLGTTLPEADLHIEDSTTASLRLRQNTSGGGIFQTFDLGVDDLGFFATDASTTETPFDIRKSAPDGALRLDVPGLVVNAEAGDYDLQVRSASDTPALHVEASNARVGVGTDAPTARLHVVDSSDNINLVTFEGPGVKLSNLISTNGGAAQYRMITNSSNRRFVGMNNAGQVKSQMIFADDSVRLAGATDTGANLWAVIGPNGIRTQGPSCAAPNFCDAVFDPAVYTPVSIEDNAAFMWENKYLPAVGPTGPDLPFNVTEKTAGILHELEKAHIYIEQLNTRARAQEAENAALSERLATIEALLARP